MKAPQPPSLLRRLHRLLPPLPRNDLELEPGTAARSRSVSTLGILVHGALVSGGEGGVEGSSDLPGVREHLRGRQANSAASRQPLES